MIFREYLKSKIHQIMSFLICVAIFALVFYLMHIELNAIWYPALICTVFAAIYSCYDCLLYKKKHETLKKAMNNIDVTLDNLPKPSGLIEEDYHVLLERLFKEKNRELQEIKASREETTEYVALWTHQIKTPLTALQLMSEDIRNADKAELKSRLFEIDNYADTMLQFLRLEGNVNDLVLKSYNVQNMVNQAVKYFARIFIAKGLAVEIDISNDFEMITDEKWFVFVLKQLISNALKYTDKGRIRIISKKAEDYIILSIQDTGVGIAPEDLPRIFERGYTGYNGRKDKKASGLGLYLTQRINDMLGHSITIDSKLSVGTEVILKVKNK